MPAFTIAQLVCSVVCIMKTPVWQILFMFTMIICHKACESPFDYRIFGLSAKMHKIIIFLKTRYTILNTFIHTSKLSAMRIRIVFG